MPPNHRLSRGHYAATSSSFGISCPWAGFGLMYLPGDIVHLADALNRGVFEPNLDAGLLRAAMQGGDSPNGQAAVSNMYYSNGFWAYDIGTPLGCEKPLWIPFMSGYGGIAVVLLPKGMSYSYFSDSNVHSWLTPVRELHRIEPLC